MKIMRQSNYPVSPLLREARDLCERGVLPWDAYQAFKAQVHAAKHRGIPFLFAPEEWWNWWQIDDRWSRRGLKDNGLVMARVGDIGPYSQSNVYCCTAGRNTKDVDPELKSTAMRLGWAKLKAAGGGAYLNGRRGDDHPSSRAVITPAGRFGSLALAAEHYGITRQGAFYRARDGRLGWHYDDPAASPMMTAE